MRSVRCFLWTLDGSTSSVSEGTQWRSEPVGPSVDAEVSLGEYHLYKVEAHDDGFDCYIDGRLVHQAKVPQYPSVEASATTDEDSVIIKLVNITGTAVPVEIELDCQVESEYTVQVLSNTDAEARNTLDKPDAVAPETRVLSGAGESFTYEAPAYSLSVLVLKKL